MCDTESYIGYEDKKKENGSVYQPYIMPCADFGKFSFFHDSIPGCAAVAIFKGNIPHFTDIFTEG